MLSHDGMVGMLGKPPPLVCGDTDLNEASSCSSSRNTATDWNDSSSDRSSSRSGSPLSARSRLSEDGTFMQPDPTAVADDVQEGTLSSSSSLNELQAAANPSPSEKRATPASGVHGYGATAVLGSLESVPQGGVVAVVQDDTVGGEPNDQSQLCSLDDVIKGTATPWVPGDAGDVEGLRYDACATGAYELSGDSNAPQDRRLRDKVPDIRSFVQSILLRHTAGHDRRRNRCRTASYLTACSSRQTGQASWRSGATRSSSPSSTTRSAAAGAARRKRRTTSRATRSISSSTRTSSSTARTPPRWQRVNATPPSPAVARARLGAPQSLRAPLGVRSFAV